MPSLSKIIDVHSHPILAFGEGAPDVKSMSEALKTGLQLTMKLLKRRQP